MNINNMNCNGCGACQSVCPLACISMETNDEGFLKAKASSKCINCGICKQNCSMQRQVNNLSKPVVSYAAFSLNEEVRINSSSGGVFTQLALEVLKKQGIVYGAAFDHNFNLTHKRIDKEEDLYKLSGSKYLQSFAYKSYQNVLNDLNEKKIVLFSGTPCQIYGLKKFLGKEFDELITIDLICHGVPSQKLFKDYCMFIEKINKKKLLEYKFRCKEKYNNTINYTTKLVFEDGKSKYIDGEEDIYTLRYLTNSLQSNSCFDCKFCNLDRVSDLTLGDYWGYNKIFKNSEELTGVSLVLVNSKKGKKLLESLNNISLKETKEEDFLKYNHHLYKPANKSTDRDELYKSYVKNGFSLKFYIINFLSKKYGLYVLKRKIKRRF